MQTMPIPDVLSKTNPHDSRIQSSLLNYSLHSFSIGESGFLHNREEIALQKVDKLMQDKCQVYRLLRRLKEKNQKIR